MLVIFEGLILSFWLLLICVVGIANGPVGLVVFYEQDVKDKVVELGLTTTEKIKRISTISSLALFIPQLTVIPVIVYFYNGVNGFWNGFLQLLGIYMIANLFDRLFIDEWWVGQTKSWIIPGTEDLRPYIPTKTKLVKWVGSCIGYSILSAVLSGIMQLIG
ncbi:hypothetical protein SAMN06297422_11482 [Lachnospiraceae bacterium]|nr:hypothetical protein SAMN06297422_11482 [Lachnospiraceae bacterium]